MADIEKLISELVDHIESALAVDSDYVDCVRTDTLQTVVGLLKEKRPTGQWDYGTQCSVCKGTIIPPKDRKVRVNFCPWCGADMRGGYDE